MTNIPETVIAQAVELIISTRDLCGNERATSDQVGRDNGIKEIHVLDKLFRIASFRANAKWNTFQRAAGVEG